MDLVKEEKGSESWEEGNGKSRKCCSECGTCSTPLWRGGPAGPRTLCNACGIKYNKKRRQILLGYSNKMMEKKKQRSIHSSDGDRGKERLKMRLIMGMALESERSVVLREEERAALLLMALSSGSHSLCLIRP